MVGKTTTRRITPIIDFGEELLEHPQSSTFTANTFVFSFFKILPRKIHDNIF